jgi:hypothetical protein
LNVQTRLSLSRLRLRLVLQQDCTAESPQVAAQNADEAVDWLKSAAAMTNLVAREWLRPMAQRSPVKLVLGAAAVGGALVLLKPWGWISIPTLAAGLMPQLLGKLVTQLPPVSWVEVLSNWLQANAKPEAPS